MKIQTLTLVAGTSACNAKCPFCVSRMTGNKLVNEEHPLSEHSLHKAFQRAGLDFQEEAVAEHEVNLPKLHKALQLAKSCGSTTVLITGKGEPTLYPHDVSLYIHEAYKYSMPIIELQTNGLALGSLDREGVLAAWAKAGLDTVAISVVHWDGMVNRQLMTGERPYIYLEPTMDMLHKHGIMVRLTCTMVRDCVDDSTRVAEAIQRFAELGADQISFAPVRVPHTSEDQSISRWVEAHGLSDTTIRAIRADIARRGHKLMTLPHGAEIYDIQGISVCLRDCLTIDSEGDDIRQLIYFPDGRVMYDWQYKGARLL